MIKLLKESVVHQDTDAIVNAANKYLRCGGGVCGAIFQNAGYGLQEECDTLHGCKTGDVKITKGYDLKAKFIFHAVGPEYSHCKEDELLLANCYKRCMDLVRDNNLKSISFCCISTGIFGYPLYEASKIAINTVKKWLEENDYDVEVRFCCFKDDEYQTYKKLLEE
ncbi:MAG: macro domain-containing protein [Erysipelotrichaceae bacterium]|nr:macro domain-containing protein [Erysipelotrichaceae bacterium]